MKQLHLTILFKNKEEQSKMDRPGILFKKSNNFFAFFQNRNFCTFYKKKSKNEVIITKSRNILKVSYIHPKQQSLSLYLLKTKISKKQIYVFIHQKSCARFLFKKNQAFLLLPISCFSLLNQTLLFILTKIFTLFMTSDFQLFLLQKDFDIFHVSFFAVHSFFALLIISNN